MSIVAYFDHIPYFTGDILLGALIDTGVDPQKLEGILNQYHGIGSKIDLKLGEAHGTKVVSVSVSATKKLRRESIWATLMEGKESPAGELIGKVISNIETHAKTCEKGKNLISLADDDWDADGIVNTLELNSATPFISPWDHDNDGLRDDDDLDDDSDGMLDKDEIMLWPSRYNQPSTNPWDHDDYGNGTGMANPTDPFTGPDAIDEDDDTDERPDRDWDQLEEDHSGTSDWDHDND